MKTSALEFKAAYSIQSQTEGALEVESDFRIRDLIKSAVHIAEMQAKSKDLSLQVYVGKTVPKVAFGKTDSLQQTIESCLTEAISKSAPETILKLSCTAKDPTRSDYVLKITLEWTKSEDECLQNSRRSLLIDEEDCESIPFAEQKRLCESIDGSLSFKENGSFCRVNLLLKLSNAAKN